jgi:hypothetical protein
MRVSRGLPAIAAATVSVALAASCSSGSTTPAGPPTYVPPTTDSGPYVPVDGGSRDSSGPAPADAKSEMPLGTLYTVDEPDTPCVPFGGSKVTLFGATATVNGTTPYATRLSTLGTSRLGATENFPGFFTFDPTTGGNAAFYPSSLGPLSSFASEGATVGGAAGGDTIVYQRYDAQGNPVGTTVGLSPQYALLPDGVWIGSGGGQSLAVWSTNGSLYAGGITSAGTSAGPSWTVAAEASGVSVSIAYNGSHFGIAYSITPTATTSAAFFSLADPAGPVEAPVAVASGGTTFSVSALTATPTGFALLALGAGGDNHTYVLPLDSTGHPQPPAHRLLGADQPWSIAAFGNDLGVAISGDDVGDTGEQGPRPPLFRPLDGTGHALGPWVCLDDPVPRNALQNMGIAADTNGYSVVYLSPSSTTILARFDPLGTGPQ